MQRADLRVFDPGLDFEGRAFEIVCAAAAELLRGKLAQDARTDVLDELELERVSLAAVLAREQKFQRFGEIAQRREEGLPPVALKAMVTPTNVNWSSLELFEALRQEHAQLNR